MEIINKEYLAKLNMLGDYPDFKKMGAKAMADFIIANDPNVKKHASELIIANLAIERSPVELEIWCKEIYLKMKDHLKRCVASSPASTISINAALP
jgi:hypothetical protein